MPRRERQTYILNDWSGGLNFRDSPRGLENNELAEAWNVNVNDKGLLESRPGVWPVSSIPEGSDELDRFFRWDQRGTSDDFFFVTTKTGDLRYYRFGPQFKDVVDSIYFGSTRRHFVNMLDDGDVDFESGLGNWTSTNGTILTLSQSSAQAYKGTNSMLLTYSGTTGTANASLPGGSSARAVRSDTDAFEVAVYFWFYVPSGNTQKEIKIWLQSYEDNDTAETLSTVTTDATGVEDQWNFFEYIFNANNTTDAKFRFEVGLLADAAASDLLYIDQAGLSTVEATGQFAVDDIPSYLSLTPGQPSDPTINFGALNENEIPGSAFEVFNDVVYFSTNGHATDEVWKFDGTTWTQITDHTLNETGVEFPYAKFLLNIHDRMFAFNVKEGSGPTNYRSRVWFSNPGDAEKWGALDWIDVAPDDGSEITGAVGFSDGIVIFKNNSVFYLSGTDANSFTLYPVQENVGCQSPRTIQVVENQVIWLDANKGWFAYDGANVIPISDKIADQFLDTSYSDPELIKLYSSFVFRNIYYCSTNIDANSKTTWALNIRNGAWTRHSMGFKYGLDVDGVIYLASPIIDNQSYFSYYTGDGVWYLNASSSTDLKFYSWGSASTKWASPPTIIKTGLNSLGDSTQMKRLDNVYYTTPGSSGVGKVFAGKDRIDHFVIEGGFYNSGVQRENLYPFKMSATEAKGHFRGYHNWWPDNIRKPRSSSTFVNLSNALVDDGYAATDAYYVARQSSTSFYDDVIRVTNNTGSTNNLQWGYGVPFSGEDNSGIFIPVSMLTAAYPYYMDVAYKLVAGSATSLTYGVRVYDGDYNLVATETNVETMNTDGEWHLANWDGSVIVEEWILETPDLFAWSKPYFNLMIVPYFQVTGASSDFEGWFDYLQFAPADNNMQGMWNWHSLQLAAVLQQDDDAQCVPRRPWMIDEIGAVYWERRGPWTKRSAWWGGE